MSPHRLILAAAVCLVATHALPAAASPADALEHVEDGLAAADREGGRCRRAIYDELLEIRDLLRDDRAARAGRKLEEVQRRAARCPERVERSLRSAKRALDRDPELDDRRDRRRDRADRRDRRRDDAPPPPPPRATDVPWADFGSQCLAHWLSVEAARGRVADATLEQYAGATRAACTNPNALAATTYYANGQTATSGGTWYFPNGQTAVSHSTFYYPNGQTLTTSGGTWYYPTGQTAFTPGTGWYYPNGQVAGAFESLTAWARARATPAQVAAFDRAMISDAEAFRVYATIRLAAQVRR